MTASTDLLDQIAAFESPNVFNPWRHVDPLDSYEDAAIRRRERLMHHFDCDPEFLLVGEAPGYQGCHFAGVAFTNESLVFNWKVPRLLGGIRFTDRPMPWSEPSATIVWNHLHALEIAERTVMWNAFAWHPHKPGEPMSNRAPTKQELHLGADVLKAVLKHFSGVRVVAIGQVAAKALPACGVWKFDLVRHPSMGGANKFREQMNQLAGKVPA